LYPGADALGFATNSFAALAILLRFGWGSVDRLQKRHMHFALVTQETMGTLGLISPFWGGQA